MDEEIEDDAKGCPFCGHGTVFFRKVTGGYRIWCGYCGSTGPLGDSRKEAHFYWNDRPQVSG